MLKEPKFYALVFAVCAVLALAAFAGYRWIGG